MHFNVMLSADIHRVLPLQGLEKQYAGSIPQLDPAEDFGVEEPHALAAAAKLSALHARLAANAVYQVRQVHPTYTSDTGC